MGGTSGIVCFGKKVLGHFPLYAEAILINVRSPQMRVVGEDAAAAELQLVCEAYILGRGDRRKRRVGNTCRQIWIGEYSDGARYAREWIVEKGLLAFERKRSVVLKVVLAL